MSSPLVGIIMGSDSDLPVMSEAFKALDELNVPYQVHIVSAHRTPDWLREYATSAELKGILAIIAGAGGAAHLPGMTAAWTTIPVIGVPIQSNALSGWDSLLPIAQMPPGVPVGTQAINGAKNAALYAAQIVATTDSVLRSLLNQQRAKVRDEVLEKNKKLQAMGWKDYLAVMRSEAK